MKFEHAESLNVPAFVRKVRETAVIRGRKEASYNLNFESLKEERKVYGICYRVVSL